MFSYQNITVGVTLSYDKIVTRDLQVSAIV